MTLYVVIIMLAIKAAVNIPLIMQFQTVGAVMGTFIALGIGVIINLFIIRKYGEFRVKSLARPLAQIVFYSIIMVFAVELVYLLLMMNMDVTTKLNSVITLLVTVPVGALIYVVLSFRSGLADQILGARADKIRRKLKVL